MEKTTLTPDELEALGWALDMAHDDQQSYLATGTLDEDYGREWPEVARNKAKYCRALAVLTGSLGLAGDVERWNHLAGRFDESAAVDEDCRQVEVEPCL